MEKKIYGEYQGNIKNIEEIEKLSEVELFMAISSLHYHLLEYQRMAVFNMPRGFDTTEDEYALQYLMNKTQKFGVELEKDKQGKVIIVGDFAGWYEYHTTHFGKILSKEEFRKFLELKSKGYNVSRYLPDESYLQYKKRIAEEQKNYQKLKLPV